MTLIRELLKSGVRGALVGVALAAMAPQGEDVTAEGCRCSDFGTGYYSCSGDHMSCDAGGSEACIVVCD